MCPDPDEELVLEVEVDAPTETIVELHGFVAPNCMDTIPEDTTSWVQIGWSFDTVCVAGLHHSVFHEPCHAVRR